MNTAADRKISTMRHQLAKLEHEVQEFMARLRIQKAAVRFNSLDIELREVKVPKVKVSAHTRQAHSRYVYLPPKKQEPRP